MKITEIHQFKFALISKVIIVILGILSGVFINRFLGPSLKGEYTFLLITINFFAMFLNLGIYESFPYFQRKSNEDLQNTYINIIFFQFLFYFFIFLVIIFIIRDFYIQFILILLPQFILGRQLTFILLVKNPNLKNLALIANHFSYMLLLLLLYIFAERSSYYVYLIIFLQEIILIITFLLFFRIKINPFKINFTHFKESIKFGIFPMLTSVLIFLIANIDIIILKIYVNFYEIGIYSVGVGLASMAWFLPDAFKEVLFSKTSKEDSISEIKFTIKTNFYASILILVSFIIFGESIILFLYGKEFINAYLIAVILFIGNIPMIFYKVIMTLFLAQGKKKLSFILLLIPMLLSFCFFFVLIPLYGIVGAAISATISHFILGVLFLIFFLKLEKIKFFDLFLIQKDEILYFFRER